MKLLFVACAVLATANFALSARTLEDDIDDFMELLPVEEISRTFMYYWDRDDEFQEMKEYFATATYKNYTFPMFYKWVLEWPELRGARDYLEETGVDLEKLAKKYFDTDFEIWSSDNKKGVVGFLKYLDKKIPYEEIVKLYKEKLRTSEYIADFDRAMRSMDAQRFVDRLWSMHLFQSGVRFFESLGVRVEDYMDFLNRSFGIRFQPMEFKWDRKKMSLFRDFKAIVKELPVEDMRDMFYYYFKSDEVFKKVMDYVFSMDFKKVMMKLEMMPETSMAISFMERRRFPMLKFINFINYMLDNGIKNVPDVTPRQITGELAGFLKDEQTLVPWEKVKATAEERLSMSKYFRDFYHAITSNDFKMYMEKLHQTEEIQEMEKRIGEIITVKGGHYELIPPLVLVAFMERF